MASQRGVSYFCYDFWFTDILVMVGLLISAAVCLLSFVLPVFCWLVSTIVIFVTCTALVVIVILLLTKQ